MPITIYEGLCGLATETQGHRVTEKLNSDEEGYCLRMLDAGYWIKTIVSSILHGIRIF